MYGWRARIGLISAIQENAERSFYIHTPEGVAYTNARIAAPEDATDLADNLVAEAAKYQGYPIDLIVAAPMMGSYTGGLDWDKETARRMEAASGAPVLTYGTAILEALNALGVKKIAIATPYAAEGNAAERKFFEDNGIEVTTIYNMDLSYIYRQGKLLESTDNYQMYGNCRKVDMAGADALYMSSMELATLETLSDMELTLNVPVVTSHQALLWAALKHSRVSCKNEKLGKLFQL